MSLAPASDGNGRPSSTERWAAAGAGVERQVSEQGRVSSPLLSVQGVSRAFGNTQALSGVDLLVAPGEIHGLCGQNGAGKSTLVKIISGQLRPDAGEIRFDGASVSFSKPREAQDCGIAIVDQELSIVSALSVEENVFLGGAQETFLVRKKRTRPQVRALLDRVGLDDVALDASAETLSMAQRQLLEIARLLGRDARLLILDEPTASLSRGDSLVVFAALRELAAQNHSILYVSHRLDEVLDLCNRVTVVRDGRLVASEPVDALNHETLVRHIIGSQHQPETSRSPARVAEQPGGATDAESKIEVMDLRVGDRVRGVSLELRAGEIVGLAGQVGSGASEVLRALAGLEPDATGRVSIDARRIGLGSPGRATGSGINFVSNDRKNEGLFLTRSIRHNLLAIRLRRLARFGLISRTQVDRHAQQISQQLSLKAPGLGVAVAALSGGNQQKVFIGRTLGLSPSHLLLLDEPTRGVDVGGRSDIHNLVRRAADEGTAVLFVSGEPDEILQLADRVICMQSGEVVSEYPAAEMTEELLLAETTRTRKATRG